MKSILKRLPPLMYFATLQEGKWLPVAVKMAAQKEFGFNECMKEFDIA